MAIDNAEKRRSVAGIPSTPLGPGVTPNASKDGEWRQQVGWGYSGISASAATAPTVEAGGPYEVQRAHTVQLAATVTPGTDADPTIAWTIQSGGSGTFSDASIEDPEFTPDETGSYVLLLTVTPNDTTAVTDTAELTSNPLGGFPQELTLAQVRRRRLRLLKQQQHIDDEVAVALILGLSGDAAR